MRYFSRKLVEALNSTDPDVVDKADQEWEYNVSRYEKKLVKLQHLLPRALIDLALHDARVLGLFIKHDATNDSEINVELVVQQANRQLSLLYSGIQKVTFKYAYRDQSHCGFRVRGLGDWLVDEISWLDNKFIRQEILFESGAVLLLEFTAFEAIDRQ